MGTIPLCFRDMKPLVVPYILNARLKKAKSPRPNVWFRNFSSAIPKFLTNNVSEDSYYASIVLLK
jgi:hypothetical protein